jgi:tRNA and rRNA cytosine-C5-methylases
MEPYTRTTLFFPGKKNRGVFSTSKKNCTNAIAQLQPGGSFVYITCSVFKKENEEVAMYIKENFHLKLKQMEVLKGYDKKADSMFVAYSKKNYNLINSAVPINTFLL